MNTKLKAAGAAAALLSLGAVKACSKAALVATHTGAETVSVGLSHAGPGLLHGTEVGIGDTGAIARGALHQSEAIAGAAHNVGDAAGSSSDDVSRSASQSGTHEANHEPSFMHEVGHKVLEESLKRATEPDHDNRDDMRGFNNR
jgi:hypothetical protein